MSGYEQNTGGAYDSASASAGLGYSSSCPSGSSMGYSPNPRAGYDPLKKKSQRDSYDIDIENKFHMNLYL